MSKKELSPEYFLKGLLEKMEAARNSKQAIPMAKYMKDLFPYYGIKSPERNSILRTYLSEFNIPSDWKKCVQLCWDCNEREMQYIGMEIAYRSKRHYALEDIAFFEKLITNKSWWDTVDFIASNIVGHYFFTFPDQIKPITQVWIHSDNLWLNRTCLLFQLKYKEYTDFKLLQSFIHLHKYSNEFFLKKAIGWALRQYAKTDAYAVEAFVTETELKPLSRKEALKNIS